MNKKEIYANFKDISQIFATIDILEIQVKIIFAQVNGKWVNARTT